MCCLIWLLKWTCTWDYLIQWKGSSKEACGEELMDTSEFVYDKLGPLRKQENRDYLGST